MDRSQTLSKNRSYAEENKISQERTAKTKKDEKNASALVRVAQRLRERVTGSREYKVVSDSAAKPSEPITPPVESWIWNSEYDDALKLERELISKFKEKSLEEAIPGNTISNEQGECYSISTTCVARFNQASYEKSRQLLISDLKIIPASVQQENTPSSSKATRP